MTNIEDKLLRIEAQIQAIIEGGTGLLFQSDKLSDLVTRRLSEAIRENLKRLPDGELAAPNRLILLVSHSEYELFNQDKWLRELEQGLRSIGQQEGVKFPDKPFLRVETRTQLESADLQVLPEDTSNFVTETSGFAAGEVGTEKTLPGAFLIVDGTRVFSLQQAAVNIGRRPDNHLVIDDRRVSRTHAQMRFINGEFVIFDLESNGGTFVNGARISRSILQPGDVISLAGVPIVFGIETASMGETQDLSLVD